MYSQTKLANGLEVITCPVRGTRAATVLVLVPVGSRYEEKSVNGVAHFIEHMTFKGTNKRPTTRAISRELDGVGAEYNAFTAKDHTGYWVKVPGDRLKLAVDILADILFNSKFAQVEIEREKGVILEEIKMYEDNPLFHIGSLFEETLFGRSPLGQLIIGKRETVKKLTRQKILDFKNKFYWPSNILVVLAGCFDKKKSLTLLRKYFGKIADLDKSRIEASKNLGQKFSPGQKKARIKLHFKKTKQVHLALGTPAYSYFHPSLYALQLLAIILGGNMSSRLFTQVRERKGLAYFIHAGTNIYRDRGNFEIQAGLDLARLSEAIKAIVAELNKIKKRGPTSQELARAKEFLGGKLTLSLEDSHTIASWYGRQKLLTGRALTPDEKLAKFRQVTRGDITKVAREIFKKSLLNMVLIGPLKKEKPLLKLLEI
jgi:predicted Zn-dependent peptidase